MSTSEDNADSRRSFAWVRALVAAVFIPAWAYGLMFLGAAFAGAGHGSYFLGTAPFAPFTYWNSEASFFLALLFWSITGLFAFSPSPRSVYPATVLLAIHYVGVAVLALDRSHNDLGRLLRVLEKYPEDQRLAWLWLFAYAGVNFLLWGVLTLRLVRLRSHNGKVAQETRDKSEAHA